MADINLKYLHPSVQSYITTENYGYTESPSGEMLFVADVFEHGKDNVIQIINNVQEYLFKYGNPDYARFGQAGYNTEKWLTNGGSAAIMRLLPDNASYAHAVFNIQYKNSTNGKTVIDNEGNETKINDVYLRPLVTYIGINNNSEALLESELAEDRRSYPTTDGYVDNFLFVVYPEGRGEYYNDLGFRIRLNNSYDSVMTSRVYTFDVIRFTGAAYDIIDGPFYVSFDPDAIDPNSQRSMFIENVINTYSKYVKIKFNTENYVRLASVINDEVDPYVIDVITGQSRIMEDGNRETFFSEKSGKDEDVHISLHSYSSNGSLLTSNGEIVLNISNNDDTSKDIVDIADNSRRIIYNDQAYVTRYMRTFYNWLLIDRVGLNLKKILKAADNSSSITEETFDELEGLLIDKASNLIYNNYLDSDPYEYEWAGRTYKSDYVGSNASGADPTTNGGWYLRALQVVEKDRLAGYTDGTNTVNGFEVNAQGKADPNCVTSSEMASTITTDGYISATNQHLISYYNNLMKYFQFVANYDVYNNDVFVNGNIFALIGDTFNDEDTTNIPQDYDNKAGVVRMVRENSSKANYVIIVDSNSAYVESIDENTIGTYATLIHPTEEGGDPYLFTETKTGENGKIVVKEDSAVSPEFIVYYDETYNPDNVNYVYKPVIDNRLYNSDGNLDINGDWVKIYDANGDFTFTRLTSIMYLTKADFGNANFKSKFLGTGTYTKLYLLYRDPNAAIVDVSSTALSDIIIGSNNTSAALALKALIEKIQAPITFTDGRQSTNDYNPASWTLYASESTIPSGTSVENARTYAGKTIMLDTENGLFVAINETLLNDPKSIGTLYTTVKSVAKDTSGSKTDLQIIPNSDKVVKLGSLAAEKYWVKIAASTNFNPIFEAYAKNGKLTQAFNKVSSYSTLMSKELDGKGKAEINEINSYKNSSDLDYSDYSLTTIFNFLVGGFESIVNNQGSVTDYSNYASLKYMIKNINNSLDLRNTYLTIMNVHKNKILDLSTELAKNNASVILGSETLENLFSAMDVTVTETNYLINILSTILYQDYKIFNLEEMIRFDTNKPYAYYFKNHGEGNETSGVNEFDVDPIGIKNNMNKFGKGTTNKYHGILPLLETIIINITGQNHFGDEIYQEFGTIYGGQPLINIYSDIKNGYTPDGFSQSAYETMYQIISESLGYLTTVHSIINAFINEKYITQIVNDLVGTIDISNTTIKYKGKTFSINTLYDYLNSGEDPDLTQEAVTNLINSSIEKGSNDNSYPYRGEPVHPIIQFPAFTIGDISDSTPIAKMNKDIVQSNIVKQDHVLSTLNTLCYDNVTQDVGQVIGFAEGSDGDFTYDNSSTALLKEREHKINDIRIKAYKGAWNPDVINKDLFEFDHILDANYEDAVKNAIISLARDQRQDFFFWADTKKQNTVTTCLDWKSSFTNQTYFMSIISQSQTWYDEYTSKNINLTSTYLIADLFPRHIAQYGIQYPMAGSRRGVVGGFVNMDWYPNKDQKELLYTNKVNYIERDVNVIRIGAQNTNYPNGPLGSINNMLIVLKIKRKVEKIAKLYQFEFNTNESRNSMNGEINNYLKTWTENGACTYVSANVYSSDYEMLQKIVRVDVTLQFTGVIERIVINIDCPASVG